MTGEARVHPSAEIEPGASIGPGTRVWRHAHIREGAMVGQECTIAARVFVDAGVRIGDRVKIEDNVSVFSGVEIDDEVLVGPSAVFTNDRYPRAVGEWQRVPTRVRRAASIGANATLVCGIEVGEGALVAAGSVVTRDVEPYELVAGNPARRLGWVCACGRVLRHTDGPRPATWRCSHCGRSSPDDAPIPLHAVEVGEDAERLVRGVLRSGRLAQGPMVARFEEEWAERAGVRHAVAVTSGTTALLLALRASGIGPGDEVVTTPLTFSATLSTILEVGAVARFADVAEDGCLDPAAVQAALSSDTRALLPVHLYGLPADMGRISAFAASRGLAVIEDAAQAAGAKVGGRAVGSFGVGCFSFYATKNLTTGEGGMVTSDDDTVATQARLLRDHGRGPGGEHVVVGHNHRMTELQAAVGLGQTGHLDRRNQVRRHHAALLTEGLRGLPGLRLPAEPEGRTPVYSLYTVRVTSEAPISRDELAAGLLEHGVETAVYYPRLVFDHPAFAGHPQVKAADVPRARAMVGQVLSLPVHPKLSPADLRRVVELFRGLFEAGKAS